MVIQMSVDFKAFKKGTSLTIGNLPHAAEPYFMADFICRAPKGQTFLFITQEGQFMDDFAQEVQEFFPNLSIFSFPDWDCLPYDRISPSAKILSDRIETLSTLFYASKESRLIITTPLGLIQRLPPKDYFLNQTLTLKIGVDYDPKNLLKYLTENGYERSEVVRQPGQYAVRGGLVDCFPTGFASPFRLDFFGDTLESIKSFDVESQLSSGVLSHVIFKPMNEVILTPETTQTFRHQYRALFGIKSQSDPLYESIAEGAVFQGMEHWLPLFYKETSTLLDYLPKESFVFSSYQALEKIPEELKKIQEYYKFRLEESKNPNTSFIYRPLSPEQFYVETLSLSDYKFLSFSPFKVPKGMDSSLRPLPLLDLPERLKSSKSLIFTSATVGGCERLKELLPEELPILGSWDQAHSLPSGSRALVPLSLEHGFSTPKFEIITETDIFGKRLGSLGSRKRSKKKDLLEMDQFQIDDFLVHQEHGIGRYAGLQQLTIQEAMHECLCLLYDEGAKLFVPVENMEVLSFYASKESEVTLDRLGGTNWQIRKARTKKRIKEIAEKLMTIAAKRKLTPAESFVLDLTSYEKFCALFPYVETEDQKNAIQDALEDLKGSHPMDRLICGEVGFGKTEVALRAAFMVAAQGAQVAILAPTTLLARQHYETFEKRFKSFNLKIALLSRFQSLNEAKKIKEDVEKGDIKILIGTHSLLTPTLKFKDLGLLIVDEEQHFGVQQKELLKKNYPHIHVLSLSATPIPRTLQMAISGIRELSLITTPPMERIPIQTSVFPFDGLTVREALLREKERGGQSFFVCPRLADIPIVEKELQKLLPHFKMAIATGQMESKDLETTIVDFCHRKYDLLISTNIIESGLDIPSANTMIVYRSDLFGLASLYQLRGRVGRSNQQGYVYFTVTPEKTLTKNAEKRLEVLQSLSNMGESFRLASYDMDIRGPGNLVGEEQAGQMKEVGLGLYQHMLEEALTQLRNPDSPELLEQEWSPQINLGLEILISDKYVADLNLRLNLYRRIAQLKDPEDIEAFRVELRDRFGPIPQETLNLLETVLLKNLCKSLNIHKLEGGPKGILISFYENFFPKPDVIFMFIHENLGTIKLRPDQKMVILRSWNTTTERLKGLHKLLGQFLKKMTYFA
jgi:transcription-repair coupling factor (superfamily II helicase)